MAPAELQHLSQGGRLEERWPSNLSSGLHQHWWSSFGSSRGCWVPLAAEAQPAELWQCHHSELLSWWPQLKSTTFKHILGSVFRISIPPVNGERGMSWGNRGIRWLLWSLRGCWVLSGECLRGYMGFFGLLCHMLKNGHIKLWKTELDGVSGLFWVWVLLECGTRE